MDQLVIRIQEVYWSLYPNIKDIICCIVQFPNDKYCINLYTTTDSNLSNIFRDRMESEPFKQHFEGNEVYVHNHGMTISNIIMMGPNTIGIFCLDSKIEIRSLGQVINNIIRLDSQV